MSNIKDNPEWIIQRRVNALRDEYEPWPGYFEVLLTKNEMILKLHECSRRWPDHEFRGRNVMNENTPNVRLQIIGEN